MASTVAQSPTAKTRRDFQRLTELRVKEAVTLAKSSNPQGAYYLAGLAVECALKACIAKKTGRHDFPPSPNQARGVYSHDLGDLLKLAGLADLLVQDTNNNYQLMENRVIIKAWSVDCRYETSGLNGKAYVNSLNSPEGALAWIKLHW